MKGGWLCGNTANLTSVLHCYYFQCFCSICSCCCTFMALPTVSHNSFAAISSAYEIVAFRRFPLRFFKWKMWDFTADAWKTGCLTACPLAFAQFPVFVVPPAAYCLYIIFFWFTIFVATAALHCGFMLHARDCMLLAAFNTYFSSVVVVMVVKQLRLKYCRKEVVAYRTLILHNNT